MLVMCAIANGKILALGGKSFSIDAAMIVICPTKALQADMVSDTESSSLVGIYAVSIHNGANKRKSTVTGPILHSFGLVPVNSFFLICDAHICLEEGAKLACWCLCCAHPLTVGIVRSS